MDTGATGVTVAADVLPVFNYSNIQALQHPMRGLSITNDTDAELTDVLLRVDSATDLLTDRDFRIPSVPARTTLEVDCSSVDVDTKRLLQLTERMTDNVRVTAYLGQDAVASADFQIVFFAFDQWLGTPETLAAFVTPNHPSLAPVIVRASEVLREWTGSAAFDGYQSGDPARVRLQAAALFRALQEQGIVYVGAPASFSAGQRIRMADAVLSQHMATCLDFSCLYASCLEAVGLRPFVVVIKGHAFAGVWLEESTFPETVEEDATAVSKRFQKGVGQLTVVQATMIAQGSKATFEDAELSARSMVDPDDFLYAVDVKRARYSQIIPLPNRVMSAEGWNVEAPKAELGDAVAPERRAASTAVLDVEAGKATKRQLWERSLLDLSMRNGLLNMRPGKRLMPLLIPSVDELEDFLAQDNDIVIAPRPNEFPDLDADVAASVIDVPEEAKRLLRGEFKDGRLRTAFTQAALQRNLTNLFRSSRSAMEETGSSTLFLTLGTLKWVDAKRGGVVRYAPIMLFPIDIIRKSARAGYVMRPGDEEPQANFSLVEMLRADYGISINGLDPLPQDESGVDTRLVLNTFLSKVMDQPGWEVLENGMIGLFSFSQFVMWNDIHSHEDELRQSKVVASLMDGRLAWQAEPIDPDEKVDPSELLLPAEADASQMLAIKKAAIDGQSFVLHGPPGTGKSQTITLLIANALARGKRVLFVAEKMAALEVVEQRLAHLGLAPFCLEVHSTKATKNHVFEQIKAASEIGGAERPEAYASKAQEVRALRGRLDRYARGLEAKNGAGFTLRELICRYESLARTAEPMAVSRAFTDSIQGQEDFALRMNAAERLLSQSARLAPWGTSPLAPLKGSQYHQGLRDELPGLLDAYEGSLRALEAAADAAAAALGMPEARSVEALGSLEAAATSVRAASGLPAAWTCQGSLSSVLRDLGVLIEHRGAYLRTQRDILERRTDSFFGLRSEQIRAAWVEASSAGMLRRGKATAKVLSELSLSSREPVGKDDVPSFIADLEAWERVSADMGALTERMRPCLEGFVSIDGSVAWGELGQAVSGARSLMASGGVSEDALRLTSGHAGAREAAGDLLDALAAERMARAELERRIGRLETDGTSWAEGQLATCEAIRANLDGLREWMGWNEACEKARSLGLVQLVDFLRDHAVEDGTLDSFECGAFKTMAMAALDATEGMNSFAGARFTEVVRQYARADRQLRELARQEACYEVAARTPDLTGPAGATPEAVALQRALRSRGRNVTIRSVFRECGDLVFSLCPCLLMSPLSVAQYLEPGKRQFDLVVFDEASQLQTCKAVGALSRAKEAVVVGDPKQMPPTSFFQGTSSDEDFEEVADLESLLEDCLALNMPQAYLRWHYRSRHESLIAFSNRRFYEGRMLTFPSADDRTSHVTFRKVAGTFDRGGTRTNRAEAEAVVAEIARRAKDPVLAGESVGVVTFNIPQQSLIDDLFQRACAADPKLDSWAHEGEEPVFIKNLENVQGDERDAILFSITYAPDEGGRMSMNFGPINREGGWRRLNVAVTRARRDMLVFSSIEPEDIDLNRTSSSGPASLRAFLEYARRGSFTSVSMGDLQADEDGDTIAAELCEELGKLGYRTRQNVGRSAYRVDVGVVDPADDGRYLAGILLDGRTYRMSGTTRDREIAQPEILEGLGWKVMRVWAIDWWEGPEAVVDKVREFLEQALAERGEKPPTPGSLVASAPAPAAEPEPEPMPMPAPEPAAVEPAPAPEPGPVAKPAPARGPASLPVIEPAPIIDVASVTEPPEKVASATDAPQAGTAVMAGAKAEPASRPATQPMEPTSPQDGPSQETPSGRRRGYVLAGADGIDPATDILAIERSELAQAFDDVLDVEAPIEEELLFRRVARMYGIVRMGNRIHARLEEGLKASHGRKVTQAGRTIVWRRDQSPKEYVIYRVPQDAAAKRSFEEIPLEEIAAAALERIERKGPCEQDDLIKGAMRSLGFSRLTPSASEYLQKGLTLGIRRGLYRRDKSVYSLPDDA